MPKTPEEREEKLADILAEFHVGTAMIGAFVFSVLEKRGLLTSDEVNEAIREASEMVPREFAASPRLAAFSALRVLLDDPEMRNTTPFRWR